MKILVTGVSGFLGTYVIRELLKHDLHIIGTSRSKDKVKKKDWFNKITYIPCDLDTIGDDCYTFFDKPDILVHLAWKGLPGYKELFHYEENLFSNYNFIKKMISGGLKNLTVTGTCYEYGLKEGCLHENLDTCPVTTYGLAKDTLRKFIEELQKTTFFHFKWLRLFYLFGEGQHPTSLLELLKKAAASKEKIFNMSGGEQLRDFLAVEKAAEYIVKSALQNEVEGVINCCSGNPVSIRKLVEDFLKRNNLHITLNPGYYPYIAHEPMAFWGDTKKLKQILKAYEK